MYIYIYISPQQNLQKTLSGASPSSFQLSTAGAVAVLAVAQRRRSCLRWVTLSHSPTKQRDPLLRGAVGTHQFSLSKPQPKPPGDLSQACSQGSRGDKEEGLGSSGGTVGLRHFHGCSEIYRGFIGNFVGFCDFCWDDLKRIYWQPAGDDLTIFLPVNLSETVGHGNHQNYQRPWQQGSFHQPSMETNRNWGSKLTGFSVGHQGISQQNSTEKSNWTLLPAVGGILALTIAGNILDLWINTLNKHSLDGSLTFLT